MSKQSGDKINKTFSVDYYFGKGLELLSMKKGIPMSQIIQESVEAKHPEILEQKTKIIRRAI